MRLAGNFFARKKSAVYLRAAFKYYYRGLCRTTTSYHPNPLLFLKGVSVKCHSSTIWSCKTCGI